MAAVNAHAARWKSVERTEAVLLSRAAGRVLATGLRADTDQPPFPRSTRDGYACRAKDASAYKTLRVAGMTHAGQPPAGPLAKGTAWEIMTGAAVPRGADAVMMLEHVERVGDTVRLLPPLINKLRLIFCDLVSCLFCSFFAWKSILLLHEAWVDGQTTSSSWAPPLWIPYGFMTTGMILLSLQILLQLVAGIVRKEH